MSFSSLFGSELNIKEGGSVKTVNTDEHLNGKHVLVYFSAHWCPPCRGFTPQLATWYEGSQKTSTTPFEIVFASSDRDAEAFNEYYATMPWAALPFDQRDAKAKLSSKYKVSGIPTLVVLNPAGELITSKGREGVMRDPKGFPWTPKSIMQVLETSPLQSANGEVPASSLKGKPFGLYFSAHWCPPCRGFTPKLVETYNAIKAQNKEFEIVFVSADRKPKDYEEYFASMPWLSLGFQDDRADELNELCEVEGIPQLSLFNEQGEVVSHEGRTYASNDPSGADFPWKVQPLQSIDFVAGNINSDPCLIGFFPDDDQKQSNIDMMKSIAGPYTEANKRGEKEDLYFFYAVGDQADSGLGKRICELFSVNRSKPSVLFVKIPAGFKSLEPNADAINEVITQLNSNSLQLDPLPPMH